MNVVGPYEVLDQLGRGGMGVVFRARDTRTGQEVALKQLLSTSDERARRRLVQEGQALKQLRHRNIVSFLDVGEHDGQPWIALELVRGGSLHRRLEELPSDLQVDPFIPPLAGSSAARVLRGASFDARVQESEVWRRRGLHWGSQGAYGFRVALSPGP